MNFLPPDSIVELVPSMATIQFTRNYADYVQQLPIPLLKTDGIDNIETIGEINSIQQKINEEYPHIQQLAGEWFGITESDIMGIFTDLQHFANVEFHSYYDYINYHLKDSNHSRLINSLKRLSNSVLAKQLNAKKALSALDVYETGLKLYSTKLQTTYTQAKNSLSNLSEYTEQLDQKRTELQAQLKANNKEVASTALKEAKDVVQNGVAIATSVASEKYTDAVKTGAILAVNAAEAGVNIVSLDVQSIKLIGEIRDLTLKLSDVERDLQVLNNAVAQMSSITQSHEFSKDIITTLEGYWRDLGTYITSLITEVNQNKELNLPNPKLVDQSWVDTVADPLKKVLSFSTLSSLAEWNVNDVSFVSTSKEAITSN